MEKSSSVAAMLDHGLPVLVTRDDWYLRQGRTPEPNTHPLLFRLDNEFNKMIINGFQRAEPDPKINRVAQQFIDDLPSL